MTPEQIKRLDRELTSFVEPLFEKMGRTERRRAMSLYVTGLLLDGDRKSIEPMASRLVDDPREKEAVRQRLQQCVAFPTWKDDEVRARLARQVESRLPGVEAFVIDDTGFAKKGEHSVGVARQYSGTLGRVDNCQVAVSLHLAAEHASACIGMQLYLPEAWANDASRRKKAGVPVEVKFQTKWEIALSLIERARASGVGSRVVLADAGYGEVGPFRKGLRELELPYLVGVPSSLVVWGPDAQLEVPPRRGTSGRPTTRLRDDEHPPLSLGALATQRGRKGAKLVAWREGSRGTQRSRFGAVRVRSAHKHSSGGKPGPEEWLLYEWPAGTAAPTKFWLSSLDEKTPIRNLVKLAKLRWRVERDYQEMKQEIGLDHYEGRTWAGFHHHATLCAVAHAFLALQRALFPPEETSVVAA